MRKLPRIRVSLPFFLLVALLYILDRRAAFLPTFFAVLIHESAHIAATSLCGGTVDEIDIRAFGIRVNVPEIDFMSYKREIIIAAAGPLAGMIAAGCSIAAAEVFNTNIPTFFAGVNIVITLINLIPVYPLDGGRIVLASSLLMFSMRTAYFVSYVFAILSMGILFGICAYMASVNALNPSLVIFVLYIVCCGIKLRPTL